MKQWKKHSVYLKIKLVFSILMSIVIVKVIAIVVDELL